MKIAFIYSYIQAEEWSTPLSLATEFQNRGWEVQIFSTLSAERHYNDAGIRMMLDQINAGQYEPDIIFYLDWGRFDTPLLNKDLYHKAYWITEMGDEPQNYERNFSRSDRFHLCLSPDYRSVELYTAKDRNAIWWTHFCDTVIHAPNGSLPKYDAVSTRGYGTSGILDHLQHDLKDRFKNTNGHVGIRHSEALQEGKIVVQHSRYGEITRRIFEAMACGKMVLTDRLDPATHIEDLFKDHTDLVYYNDYNDCLKKLEYYASHNDERELIAACGKYKVTKHHTQYQRVNTILEHFRRWKA